MKRGDIWWANLPLPMGRRPVLLLSRNDAYEIRSMIIVSTITSRRRILPTEILLGVEEGLVRPSVVNLDNILTTSKRNLVEYISTLTPQQLRAVEAAIHFALGLET